MRSFCPATATTKCLNSEVTVALRATSTEYDYDVDDSVVSLACTRGGSWKRLRNWKSAGRREVTATGRPRDVTSARRRPLTSGYCARPPGSPRPVRRKTFRAAQPDDERTCRRPGGPRAAEPCTRPRTRRTRDDVVDVAWRRAGATNDARPPRSHHFRAGQSETGTPSGSSAPDRDYGDTVFSSPRRPSVI